MLSPLYIKNSLIFNKAGALIDGADIRNFRINEQSIEEQTSTYALLKHVPNLKREDKEWIISQLEDSCVPMNESTLSLSWIIFPESKEPVVQFPNYKLINGIYIRDMKRNVITNRVPIMVKGKLILNDNILEYSDIRYIAALFSAQEACDVIMKIPVSNLSNQNVHSFFKKVLPTLSPDMKKMITARHLSLFSEYLYTEKPSIEDIKPMLQNKEYYTEASRFLISESKEIPPEFIDNITDADVYGNYVLSAPVYTLELLTKFDLINKPMFLTSVFKKCFEFQKEHSIAPNVFDVLNKECVKVLVMFIAKYCEMYKLSISLNVLTHVSTLYAERDIDNEDLYSVIRMLIVSNNLEQLKLVSNALYASCIYNVLARIIDSKYEGTLSYLEIVKTLCAYSTADISQTKIRKQVPAYNRSNSPRPHRRALGATSPPPDEISDSDSDFRSLPTRGRIVQKYNDSYKPSLNVIRNFFEYTGKYAYKTLYHVAIECGKHMLFPIELCPEPIPSLHLEEYASRYQVVLPFNRTNRAAYLVDLRAAEEGIVPNSLMIYEFPYAGNDAYVITDRNLKEEVSKRIEIIPDPSTTLLSKLSHHPALVKCHKRVFERDWETESSGAPPKYVALDNTLISLEEVLQTVHALEKF